MQQKTNFRAGLYLRLSKDDERQGESVSIETQRAILTDYCLICKDCCLSYQIQRYSKSCFVQWGCLKKEKPATGYRK